MITTSADMMSRATQIGACPKPRMEMYSHQVPAA